MQRIDKIGLEIEGGWNAGNLPNASPGICSSDPSVNFASDSYGIEAKEYQSSPTGSLLELTDWVRRIYPPHTNGTCGIHVHVSLKSPMNYARIIDKRFEAFFDEELNTWAKGRITNKHFWARLNGENKFCKKGWNPEEQMRQLSKGAGVRWTQWNFCWGVRKTAECRVLPTFKKPEVAIMTITKVVKIVEDYLALSPIALAVNHRVVDPDDDIPDELLELMR